MGEGRRRWPRLAALAAAVLAIHLWLLGGLPRMIAPVPHATPLVTRTVTPPAPSEASDTAAAQPTPAVATPTKPAVARTPAARPRGSGPAVPIETATPVSAPAPTQFAGAPGAGHVAVLPSAHFHYDVIAQAKGFTLKGQADLDWRNERGEYQVQMQVSAPFLKPRVQRSTGLITEHGLAPLRFSDKTRSEEAAHFDREHGKVTFSTNKPDAALEPGAQDRLSIVMQLSALVAGQPKKFPAGSQITVQTASTREAEPWTFTVEDTETLDLPGGRVSAVRLTRNPRRDYDTKVELWLAPGQAYAPVRLRLTQPNGDWVDQQWSRTDKG